MWSNGVAISGLIALALALFAVALALIYLADGSVRRRLSLAGGGRRDAGEPVGDDRIAWLVRLGQQVQARIGKQDAEEVGALRLSLIRAGIYAEHAPAVFSAIRAILARAFTRG